MIKRPKMRQDLRHFDTDSFIYLSAAAKKELNDINLRKRKDAMLIDTAK